MSEKDLAWRKRDNAFRAMALAERDALYPEITVQNFREAVEWFEARVKRLHDGRPLGCGAGFGCECETCEAAWGRNLGPCVGGV